jgi:hypothetical protein
MRSDDLHDLRAELVGVEGEEYLEEARGKGEDGIAARGRGGSTV